MTGAEVHDLGLQPERTTLAWRRTTLSSLCVTTLAVRAWFVHPSPVTLGLAASAAVVSALTTTVAARSGIRDRRRQYENVVHPIHIKVIGAALLAVCVFGVLATL